MTKVQRLLMKERIQTQPVPIRMPLTVKLEIRRRAKVLNITMTHYVLSSIKHMFEVQDKAAKKMRKKST